MLYSPKSSHSRSFPDLAILRVCVGLIRVVKQSISSTLFREGKTGPANCLKVLASRTILRSLKSRIQIVLFVKVADSTVVCSIPDVINSAGAGRLTQRGDLPLTTLHNRETWERSFLLRLASFSFRSSLTARGEKAKIKCYYSRL